jgi:hypothetical protein
VESRVNKCSAFESLQVWFIAVFVTMDIYKVKQSHYRPGEFQEVEAPIF